MAPNRPKRLPTPAEVAQAILRDKGLGRTLPVDVEAVLAGEVVELEYFEAERASEGRLELVEDVPTIFVNVRGRTRQHPRVRFTLGHEAGHYFLHRQRLRTKGPIRDERVILDQGVKLDDVEREANEFAIELLLPSTILKERFDRTRLIDVDFIVKLATEANVSLQATAIRVVRESEDRIAVLVVEGGVIQWVAVSDDWREAHLPAGQLKGKALPRGAVAARRADDYREERVAIKEWAPNQKWKEADLYESALNTSYGRLLFLGAEGGEDGDEEDDVEAERR